MSFTTKFITVSNLISKDPDQVVEGNERVIRPRLADARFFFETAFSTFVETTDTILYSFRMFAKTYIISA